jgi:hypothetical protein
MNERDLINAIEAKATHYSAWTIGITNDPQRRRGEHGNPKIWYHWKADSERIARNVEEYFIKKGMKGATGGGERSIYVYIFI